MADPILDARPVQMPADAYHDHGDGRYEELYILDRSPAPQRMIRDRAAALRGAGYAVESRLNRARGAPPTLVLSVKADDLVPPPWPPLMPTSQVLCPDSGVRRNARPEELSRHEIPRRSRDAKRDLEAFLLLVAAGDGRPSRAHAASLTRFLDDATSSPLARVRALAAQGRLAASLRDAFGHTSGPLERLFEALARADLDLATCSHADLRAVRALHPQGVRLFLVHARRSVRAASIDPHVVTWIRSRGPARGDDAPAARANPPRPTQGRLSSSYLRALVDEALAGTPVGEGGTGVGYVVSRGEGDWFIKVPQPARRRNAAMAARAAREIDHEVEVGEALRKVGLTRFIAPSWRATSSSGVPALVREAGERVNARDLDLATLAELEAFLARVERSGWRVRDDIQVVRGRHGVFLTDLGSWAKAKRREDPSELDRRLREMAYWAAGTSEETLLTLPEILDHERWLRARLRTGTLPANQPEVEREQWLPAIEERRQGGLPVPLAFERLVRFIAEDAPVETRPNPPATYDVRRLYHGTCPPNAAALLREGWAPRTGRRGPNGGNPAYLYVSSDPQDARWFAEQRGCDTVVEVRDVPPDALGVDPEDGLGKTVEDEIEQARRVNLPAKLTIRRPIPASHFRVH